MLSPDVDQWIEAQLEQAPEPSDATMRRLSALLFGGEQPGALPARSTRGPMSRSATAGGEAA